MSIPLIVVDGNFAGWQVYHALKPSFGESVIEAMPFGFTQGILNLASFFGTNRFAFCWDGRESIRRKLLPSYKANRKPLTPEDKAEKQCVSDTFVDIATRLVPLIGFSNTFSAPGFESDDLQARVIESVAAKDEEQQFIIFSSDHDLWQLLSPTVRMWNGKKMMTERRLMDEKGITPAQWLMVKQMAGCDTDNVPGIDGVGETTAIKFIRNELNPRHKIYTKIHLGGVTIDQNLPLVKVPHKDTPTVKLVRDNFSELGMLQVCQWYEMDSLFKRSRWLPLLEPKQDAKGRIREAMESDK